MSGKKSKLASYENDLIGLRKEGVSYREIATWLNETYGVRVTHNAVFSFLNTRERTRQHGMDFLQDLPTDIRNSLIKQLVAVWTCESTGLEGNTLTIGETIKVLEHGLTISGKALKDHEEVYGHAKAIDLILELTRADRLEKEDLFNLHRCVMQKSAIDSLRPIGNWKRDYNGTTGIQEGKPTYMEYARPEDTPRLMARWLKEFNRKLSHATSPAKAINVYTWSHLSFVRIHPFFDGNGRIARLLSNLPLLKAGLPPILISTKKRSEYIDLLWAFERKAGVIKADDTFLPRHSEVHTFKAFLKEEWNTSLELAAQAHDQAQERKDRDA